MPRLGLLVIALLTLASLATVPVATAAVRTAVVVDVRDGWPTAAGVPSTPDLGRVEVAYDPAGALAVTADLFEDVRGLSTERAYAWSLRFALGRPSPIDPTACVPIVQGHVQLAGLEGVHIADRLAITGADGYLPVVPTFAYPPDIAAGTRLTFNAASPTLAGRDLRCVNVSIAARERTWEEDSGGVYDEACACWYIGVVDDRAPMGWFAGFGPGTAPAPHPPVVDPRPRTGPRSASAIRVVVDRDYCQLTVALTSLTPGEGGGQGTTHWGSLLLKISGASRRTVTKPLGRYVPGITIPFVVVKGLPGGTYSVAAKYTGDSNRQPSPVVSKSIRVVCQ